MNNHRLQDSSSTVPSHEESLTDSERHRSKKGCYERYDVWAWSSGVANRHTKAQNCITGSKLTCHNRCLMVFRLVCMLLYWVVFVRDSIVGFRDYHFFELQFFTEWGVTLTTLYFTFATITHIRYWDEEKKLPDSGSFFHSWKLVSALFITAHTWECVISSVYWTVLYPDDKSRLVNAEIKWWNFC